MADTTTANDWASVKSEATAKLETLKAEAATYQQQYDAQVLTGRVSLAVAGPLSNLKKQISETEQIITNANNQIELAQDAPSGTRANPVTQASTPPVNPEPGNNTDFTPPEPDPAWGVSNYTPSNVSGSPESNKTIDATNAQAALSTSTAGSGVPADTGVTAVATDTTPFGLANMEPAGVAPSEENIPGPTGTTPFALANMEPASVPTTDPGLYTPPVDTPFALANMEPAALVPGSDPALAGTTAFDLANMEPQGDSGSPGTNSGVTGSNGSGGYPSVQTGLDQSRSSGNLGREVPFPTTRDYRVRISLAPSANYLYNIATQKDLLYPLKATRGVIYPYTPTINVTYSANYAQTDITHSNYKMYNYTGSSIDNIQITGDFTAQDINEANYVLAVMHFFRSVTKMFYGQDNEPIRGVPPPLVYLTGHGEYGFDNHPMVVTNFTLNYPTDCDYINAGPTYNVNASLNPYTPPNFSNSPSNTRLLTSGLRPGGVQPPPTFTVQSNTKTDITRVPTKLQISINAYPIVTRNNISNNFSLKEYATGRLLKGSQNPVGGGIW